MPLRLRWRDATNLTVEADALRPDTLAARPAHEVTRLSLPVGNGRAELGELFQVDGTGSDGELVVEGNLGHVQHLGAGMAAGRLVVEGDAGDHLGARMSGGTLELAGSAGHWAGAEMSGGLLRVRGSVGDGLGAACPGSPRGMREGVILVEGSAGNDAGLAMRRGFIAVAGAMGQGAGRAMIAGTVFAFGAVGPAAAMGMKRGTLACFGLPMADQPPLVPTFVASCRDRPTFVSIYLRQLQAWGFPVPEAAFCCEFQRYNGDPCEHGQGEVLVAISRGMGTAS